MSEALKFIRSMFGLNKNTFFDTQTFFIMKGFKGSELKILSANTAKLLEINTFLERPIINLEIPDAIFSILCFRCVYGKGRSAKKSVSCITLYLFISTINPSVKY